jgi:hypothetical protein
MATSKEIVFSPLLDADGQAVSGATITVNAVGGATTLYTMTEPDPTNYPGYMVLVAPTGQYDIYINGVYSSEFSPHFHADAP